MEEIKVKVNAKLNLSLDILGRYSDGYHQLKMLMTSVDIADVICCKKSNKCQVFMQGELAQNNNTAVKALDYLNQKFGINMCVHITKHIPMSAGLGGSSADASAVFWCACQLYNLNIKDIRDLALQVGSDVMYMIFGGSCIVEGRGEIVTPCEFKKQWFVIAQKSHGASTAQVYKQYDQLGMGVYKKDIDIYNNVLQDAAISLCSDIQAALDEMKTFADITFMTGSGSAVVGVFDTKIAAEQAQNQLSSKQYKFVKAVCSVPKGIEIID